MRWWERLGMLFILVAMIVVGTMEYNDAVERERMTAEQKAEERMTDCPPATREKRDREARRIAGLNGELNADHAYQLVTETDCKVKVVQVF